MKKARLSFYKERVSTKNEFLQRTRFYKERDSTKNEILQGLRFYKERDSTKNEILQRTRFYKERDSPERGGHFEESPTEILHISSSDSPNADAPILPTAP